ncbi:MAG: hypothetical protein IJI63_02145 [Clostridiales bacterium]|nr:hypothetical protein [Clostridiales bacterium]
MDINDGTVKSVTVADAYKIYVANNEVVVISETDVSIYDKDLNELNSFNTVGYIRTFVSGDSIVLLNDRGQMYRISNGTYDYFDTGLSSDQYSWMQIFRNGNLYAAKAGENHIYTYMFRQSEYMTVDPDYYEEIGFDYFELLSIYDQLISIADDYLDGYEPDERVKEKYSLG